jgi:LacI family transcriptional regulator
MADIASEAGVSLATVGRVFNGRGLVRPETRETVLATAARLGYLPAAIAPAHATGEAHLDVILPGGTNGFLQLLSDEIESRARSAFPTLDVTVHRVEGFDVDALARKLDAIEASDGVAVVAIEHPLVREAIRNLRARGVPVATLVSDIADIGSIGYVGIDNRASGRLAAQLLGRLVGGRKGKVVLFLGSRSYRGHEEREIGFRHVLQDEFPELEIVDVRDARDDTARTHGETLRVMHETSGVVGLYNIAGGNRGIASALEELNLRPRVVFVAHELTEHSRRMLLSGILDVAIDQNPRAEARDILALLAARAAGAPRPELAPIRITPVFRENIP